MIDQGVILCGEDFVTDGDGDRDVGVGIGEGFKDVKVGIQDLDAEDLDAVDDNLGFQEVGDLGN